MHDGRDTEVEVRYPLVDKAEDLGPGPAVELGVDPLRVCVRGQLLATVLGDQKQCEGVSIRDLELVSTK